MSKGERIQELRTRLEELGCGVIIWTADDFPGMTEADREDNFYDHIQTVIDVSIERGSEAIASLCGDDEDEEDE